METQTVFGYCNMKINKDKTTTHIDNYANCMENKYEKLNNKTWFKCSTLLFNLYFCKNTILYLLPLFEFGEHND